MSWELEEILKSPDNFVDCHSNKVTAEDSSKNQWEQSNLSESLVHELETCFTRNAYPNREMREQISQKLGLDVKFVQSWFKDRRAKARSNNEVVFRKVRKIFNLCVSAIYVFIL